MPKDEFYIIHGTGNPVWDDPKNPKRVTRWHPGEPYEGFPDKTGGRMSQTKVEDIPKKLADYDELCRLEKEMCLQGTDKYTGAEKDTWETIDVMPKAFGAEMYRGFILCDLLKRLIRWKNQRRERDIIKIRLWTYLWWKFEREQSMT